MERNRECAGGCGATLMEDEAGTTCAECERPSVKLGCPECGSVELETRETLIGSCAGDAWLEGDGERTFEGGGYTEINWDSSTTQAIECRLCPWEGQLEELRVPRRGAA
jgi:hypothetical protein